MGSSINYFNGSLYVFGYSLTYYYKQLDRGNDLYRYDLEGSYWELLYAKGDKPFGRIYHYSCVYNNELYIFFGFNNTSAELYTSIYKYNFAKNTWFLLTENEEENISSGASVQVDNVFYFIFGRNSEGTKNSITGFNLDEKKLSSIIVSNEWVNPIERKNHCSLIIGSKMYIFGGMLQRENYKLSFFNDMWTFNLENKKWSSINTYGEIPGPRSKFGCSKTNSETFAVFGGYSDESNYNDLYIFHEPQKNWYSIQADNIHPPERYSSCLCYHEYILYIIGGRNEIRAFNEIWTYSFINNVFSLTNITLRTSLTELGLFETNCWVEKKTEYFELFIAGGEDIGHNPNSDLIKIKFYSNSTHSYEMSVLGNKNDLSFVGSETSLIVTDNHLIRFGGIVYDLLILTSIVFYDRNSNDYFLLPTYPFIYPDKLSESFATYGHTLVQFKNSLYLFGGTIALEIYFSLTTINRNIKEINFHNDFNLSLSCSKGTYSKDCLLCQAGYYFHNGECKPCPKGKFNTISAATSIELCTPCPYGFYSPKNGMKYCLSCPSGYECPIGSFRPKKILNLPLNTSIQPQAYESQKSNILKMTNNLWVSFSSLAILILLLAFVFSKIREQLRRIDLFTSQHVNELEKPIIHRKTTIGGVFSIAFITFSIVSVAASILTYSLDNISEIKTLIPVIILDKKIYSQDFETTISFYLYGGDCLNNDLIENNICNEQIRILTEGLEYKSKEFKCYKFQEFCVVYIYFNNFKLSSKIGKIFIRMEEISSLSNAINLNITSSSSIPKEKSSVSVVMEPNSKNLIFKGLKPSIFYFKLTPSVNNI